MRRLCFLTAIILFAMLAIACSSDDPKEGPEASTTSQPSQGIDQVEQMHTIALDFLNAWYAMDFTTMSSLMDPEVMSDTEKVEVDQPLEGTGPRNSLCKFANAICSAFGRGNDLIPSDWIESEVCVKGDTGYTTPQFPCVEKEITNVADRERPCRDATPAEVANGYGYMCLFKLSRVRLSETVVDLR